MALYAIGDIQGCFTALNRLMDQLNFDPARDRLWFVGDLVNRGPDSLSVLRFIKNLGKAAVVVLGNHDLHLLAVAAGVAKLRKEDTLEDILRAPDRGELLHWLRHQRMLFKDQGYVLVHAGLLPQWTTAKALALAQEVERALRSPDYQTLLSPIYRCRESLWRENLSPLDRLGFITNTMTRMRVCTAKGHLNLTYKGSPTRAPRGFRPWFEFPPCPPRQETIIFGHWSALGLLVQDTYLALDGGCCWGKDLIAIRLEDRQIFRVSCVPSDR